MTFFLQTHVDVKQNFHARDCQAPNRHTHAHTHKDLDTEQSGLCTGFLKLYDTMDVEGVMKEVPPACKKRINKERCVSGAHSQQLYADWLVGRMLADIF